MPPPPTAISRAPARAEIARAPTAIQWSPCPWSSCRRSKQHSAKTYSTSPSQNSTSAAYAGQATACVLAGVAASTAKPSVATQLRNTAPGIGRR
ncbi:hypothetical protein [Streptomyces sp. NPDC002545]